MYRHNKQYRCEIIRGKAMKLMDDLLPVYANIIDKICPCDKEAFEYEFNRELSSFLGNSDKKTLDNHRTEIAGELFGMYYLDAETDTIVPSERTLKFIQDGDQPAFFKEMCYKMQFPNGMQKNKTIIQRINDGISVKPYSFLIAVLLSLQENDIFLSMKQIGYYILNSYDVLTGHATVDEVVSVIRADVLRSNIREITIVRNYAYSIQHIRELLNYLELANIIFIRDQKIVLNVKEMDVINKFASEWGEHPTCSITLDDFSSAESIRKFRVRWDRYYTSLSTINDKFRTTIEALSNCGTDLMNSNTEESSRDRSTVELGDEGEKIVYEIEKQRVKEFNERLLGKVLHLGRTHGIGYDIQSVVAMPGDDSDFVKYIEVKTTKRTTEPDFSSQGWKDTVSLTRNEYVAAMQHKKYYAVYRVYLTRDKIVILQLENIEKKLAQNMIYIVPTMYSLEFRNCCIDNMVRIENV